MERTCGNCACWDRVNELLGACTGDILKTGRLRDRREAAADCTFFREKHPEIHARYRKIVADYYEGYTAPFNVVAYASDGCRYVVDKVEVMRCRCAKWKCEHYRYTEDGECYRRETWTGPGEGIAFVTTEEYRIR